jgi:hypothetical protein
VLIGCTSETTGSSGFARNGLVCTQGTSDVFFEAIAPSGSFDVDSSEPGVTTGLRVEFLIPMGVREAHEIVVTAPSEFGFLGFDALGAGAHIGMWEFDFDDDGVFGFAGFTIDHFALGPDTAFSDSDDSGDLTSTDPTVSHALGTGGEHVFTIALPSGGDGDTSSCLSRFPTDIRYTLFSGIVVNPAQAGDYTVAVSATSIDLDTGGASDGTGPDEPLAFAEDATVTVPEPGPGSLAAVVLATLIGLSWRANPRRGRGEQADEAFPVAISVTGRKVYGSLVQFYRRSALPAAPALAAMLALCACSLTVGTNPNAYPFPSSEIPPLTEGVSVSVLNSYAASERVVVAGGIYGDLQQFTDTAVAMVQRELSSKGLVVSPDGGRTIRLRMKYPSLAMGTWSMTARVALETELGNGETFAVDGESQTGGNAMRAFNGAILRAVTGLLKDQRLAAYLNDPPSAGLTTKQNASAPAIRSE